MFPSLLPAVTFSVHIATGHTLEYNVAVAALIIFSIMQEPLIQIPYFITELVEVIQSLKRIEGFLDLEEVQTGIVKRGQITDSELALSIKGNFSWGFSTRSKKDESEKKSDSKDEKEEEEVKAATLGKFMTLKEIDFEVMKGDFVCIIGDTGAGKSSLFNSIIGDMIYVPKQEIDAFGGL